MIPEKSRDVLILFSEKAEKLLNSSVRHFLEQGKVPFRLSARIGEPLQIETNSPPDESLEAFVLTLRFFIQDNEATSIRNMSKLIAELPISDMIKERVQEGRKNFNSGLGRPCEIMVDGVHLTNGEIFDTFIYGHLAHANERKRRLYGSWASNPIIMGMMSTVFLGALLASIRMVDFLQANLEEVFVELRAAGQWPA